MAERRGIGIDEQEEEVVGPGTGAESVHGVAAGFESRQFLLLEIRFSGTGIEIAESHANYLFTGRYGG